MGLDRANHCWRGHVASHWLVAPVDRLRARSVNPSTRSRRSKPCVPQLMRSISSWTMRCCSAGNSSLEAGRGFERDRRLRRSCRRTPLRPACGKIGACGVDGFNQTSRVQAGARRPSWRQHLVRIPLRPDQARSPRSTQSYPHGAAHSR